MIPAYNEGARVTAALRRVVGCLRARGWDAEVIVVDDGSSDNTARQVLDYSLIAQEVRLLQSAENRGKGHAVRRGMLQARGEIVMFLDVDLTAPIFEAELLFAAIQAGADIAMGSRWLDKRPSAQSRPLFRQIFGRAFHLAIRGILGLPYRDMQCGFKAFRREAAQTLFPLQTVMRWGFDTEILVIATKRGMRIAEVPVAWGEDGRSVVSHLIDGVQTLREILAIKRNALFGRYEVPVQATRRVGK